MKIFVPTIVQLEVGFFHLIKGNSWDDFVNYIKQFGGELVQWGNFTNSDVLQNAYIARQKLPFRQHFRDFIIGTECQSLGCSLVTNNVSHFSWVTGIQVYSTEQFIMGIETQLNSSEI
jgi:hypothetical protein